MKRIARYVFAACLAVSLLLFAASAGLWVWSLFHANKFDVRYVSGPTDHYADWVDLEVWTFAGALQVMVSRLDYGPPYFPGNEQRFAAVFREFYPRGWKWSLLGDRELKDYSFRPNGFRKEYSDSARWAGMRERTLVIGLRLWLPTLAFAIIPAIAVVKRVRRRRAKTLGLCPGCGYDLRATPERCPECGLQRG